LYNGPSEKKQLRRVYIYSVENSMNADPQNGEDEVEEAEGMDSGEALSEEKFKTWREPV
jgi:hypothetical protein